MEREAQCALVSEVLSLSEQQTTTLAPDVLRVPAAHYVDEAHAERERRDWFLGQPHLACLSGELAEPGDYLAYEVGGLPIVVVRGGDGRARAFENVCRHRAAPVARGRGQAGRSLSCPFHGWTYDVTDGGLLARPRSCDGFASVDPSELGLQPLATVERAGLVAVEPRREVGSIDLEAWLGGLGDELASNDYARFVPFRSRVDRWPGNWKLLLETFLESYHVFSLHRKSLAPAYLGIASPASGFGPHNRLVVPMRSILELAEQPQETWSIWPHAVVQYFLAPDVILSHYHGVLAMTRFIPVSAGETEIVQALLTPGPVASEEERARHEERFAFAHAITADEDYPESARVHRSLATGRVPHLLFGRNEAGASLFHHAIGRRLGASPSQRG